MPPAAVVWARPAGRLPPAAAGGRGAVRRSERSAERRPSTRMKGTLMQTKIAERFPVRGRLRALLRLPIWLYRLRLGWLLGERGLMLTHIGRKSGQLRRTVLEVGGYDPTSDTYTIVAGWGERSDWVRNIQQRPDVL